ncbi:MAG: DUF1552 domain-containing protein [Myxococcota bacterium]
MSIRYRHHLKRRTFLRGLMGASGVTIGLPFIDEMFERSVYAQSSVPKRVVTMFFGNGVMPNILDAGDPLSSSSALSPLRPYRGKVSVLRGVDMNAGTGHPRGGGATFVGFEGREESQRGPSIDVVARNELHPQGVPTSIQTLLVASHFRRNHQYRMVHSWNEDGSPMGRPIERPSELFTLLFGGSPSPGPGAGSGEEVDKREVYRRSVLDAVLEDYQYIRSDRAGLSSQSRARISDHLDRIREVERKIFPEADPVEPPTTQPNSCASGPSAPQDPDVPYGTEANAQGVVVDAAQWTETQHRLADLYALALRCDLVRFGNLTFQASGERVRLRGPWDYNGTTIQFNDNDAHHEHWHRQRFPEVEWHIHYIMEKFAYFYGQLDDSNYPDANGRTILENGLFPIGAELGNGSSHNTRNVFHTMTGADGAFRASQNVIDVDSSSVNLYNTWLQGLGVGRTMGDSANYQEGALDSKIRT